MNHLRILLLALILSFGFGVLPTIGATDAKWIYYPGDFEIWLHKELNLKRTERNQPYPPIWRLDAPYGTVRFTKNISLKNPETASISVDGKYFIRGKNNEILNDFNSQSFTLSEGKYTLSIFVENYKTVPSILFSSPSIKSDNSWLVSSFNDDNVNASVYNSSVSTLPPSTFKLEVTPMNGKVLESNDNYTLYDFGKNTFGFPILQNLKGNGKIQIFYGESKEEAMAGKLAETWDELNVKNVFPVTDTLSTKAFRFVKITKEKGVSFGGFSMLYQYLPLTQKGSFKCSDPEINDIYQTAMYTFQLNTRECHLDGIKRDRWVWSGDALQSYLMNFYTFFDEDVNKRTLWGLRGHDPVKKHINTILDYSYYWMIGVESHYQYTGDTTFVKQIYPRMKETMNFCISRLNKNGLTEGKKEDWVFVDWAPIDKTGEVSFEQLLFIKSLKAMKQCALVANDKTTADKMQLMYDEKLKQFETIFWSTDKNAFLHNRKNGNVSESVTRYSNMFAILFDMVSAERKEQIKKSVILNDSILSITTPYMKFYELAALCEIGEQAKVLNFVKSYWGGMLKLGATTFWETYDPKLPADKHYEMYKRPFGKSLCHAWGANPVYLFGRYFLGVYPTTAAYKNYIIEPNLGGLRYMEGIVPTPQGNICVSMNEKQILITTAESTGGELKFTSKSKPICKQGIIIKVGSNHYSIQLDKTNTKYEVNYK
jgi:hypothetical protein